MSEIDDLQGSARFAARAADRLTWLVDRVCVALLVVLILDVWLGVIVRYVWPLPLTFTEELARYLMIWLALLAVSACIGRREHIGVQFIFATLPAPAARVLLAIIDVLGIVFFLFLLFYGLGMVERGAKTFTMIYGISKGLPFAAVPVAAALAALQLAFVAVRDQARMRLQVDGVIFP